MASQAKLKVVHEAELGSKGLVVSHLDDDGIVGHLMIGKANLVWFEKNEKKLGRKVSWGDFRAWVMEKPRVKATRP